MSYRRQFGAKQIKKALPYLVLLLAFALQTSYLHELGNTFPETFGHEPFCGVDAKAHSERAAGLLAGTIPGDQVFYFIPLYPIYLAIQQKFLGDSLLFPIFVQALLQIVGIAALYAIGRLTFSPLTGVLAAVGLATYNYYLFYLPCFDQALLTTPFFTLALFFLLKHHARRRSAYILGAGGAFALAILSRPTALTVLPVVVVWLFWYRSSMRQFGQYVALLMLPVLIAIAPITWHNYQASGNFVLISDNFGVNFFTGNNPDASGFDSLAHVQTQPAVLRFVETVHRVDAGETTFTIEVLRYVWEQPLAALNLTLRKSWLWFGETTELLVEPFFPLTISQSKILAWLPLEWQAIMIVALLGILLVAGRSWPRTLLLWAIYATFSIFTILFFIQLRFRLPFVPFAMLSAAALLAAAPQWSRQRSLRFWSVLIILLLLLPLWPTLGIFALIFTGLGVWPYLKQKNQGKFYGRVAVAVLGYFLLVAIWAKANALASDVSQPIDIYLGPPLASTTVLGQTFQMDCDRLNRIDITLGVPGQAQPDQPVIFHLATDISAQEILFSETFEGHSVKDYQARSFYFEPIVASADQDFFFFIASPTSTPDKAITARGYLDTPIDYYPQGSAFAGQVDALQRLQADFAFGAYCDLSLWEKIKTVFNWPN